VVVVEVEVVEVVVVVGMGVPLRRIGVPVSHVMDPPQAAPGSGVPSQVHEAWNSISTLNFGEDT
jgi:hypothetical protein